MLIIHVIFPPLLFPPCLVQISSYSYSPSLYSQNYQSMSIRQKTSTEILGYIRKLRQIKPSNTKCYRRLDSSCALRDETSRHPPYVLRAHALQSILSVTSSAFSSLPHRTRVLSVLVVPLQRSVFVQSIRRHVVGSDYKSVGNNGCMQRGQLQEGLTGAMGDPNQR